MPAWTWNIELPEGSEVVIFDLDGVISDASHRQHFLKNEEKDWDGFFSACTEDPPIVSGVELINLISKFKGVIILTARPVAIQMETLDWLNSHGVIWNALIMRSNQDNLGSAEMKLSAINEILAGNLNPILVFDDDPKNIIMFKENGIPVVSVHSGYYG
ncbi:MAG: hypothetical protein CL431_06105 [Acidimicrobiaceae bacterium]|jgi:hypothetical protein|nr:hypothetical protein [Acidimicrobiaceae bacterium]